MRRNLQRVFVALLIALFAASGFSFPHHATATEYDITKTITLKGTIAKVDWGNPHVHIRIDVKTPAGVSEDWDLEFGSPGAMAVAGIVKDDMKPGVVISIKGYPGKQAASAKDPRRACATEATLPNGLTATFVVGI
jgi:hypothetical protein